MAAIILVAGASCFCSMVSSGGMFYTCTDGTFDTEEYDSNLCLSFLSTKCDKIKTQEKCDKKKKCQWDIFAPTANCISIDDTLTESSFLPTGPSGPSGPSAASRPSGRYIKITQTAAQDTTSTTNENLIINLAEVEVYDGSGTLVSNNRTITGSSVLDSHPWANLVDGNKTNFAHTNGTTATETDYMQIDLGEVKEIKKIVITNRTDCCKDRINGLKVQILNASSISVKDTPIITLGAGINAADTYTITFPENVWSKGYEIASPIKCLNDTDTNKVYRLTSATERRHYPDPTIASSWDADWATTYRTIDCTGITEGTAMAANPTPAA